MNAPDTLTYADPRHLVLAALTERDGPDCFYCGQAPERDGLILEHVIPVRRNGPNTIDNLVLACTSCNLSKGSKPGWFFVLLRHEREVEQGRFMEHAYQHPLKPYVVTRSPA